jgi:CRISPR-associated protein Cmr3
LPGFIKKEAPATTLWHGRINGIDLVLHCAVIGKVLREGGWDMRKAQPKPVQSLIPAGCIFWLNLNTHSDPT